MSIAQPGILAPVPPCARFLTFHLAAGADAARALGHIHPHTPGDQGIVGIGPELLAAVGAVIPHMRAHPRLVGPGISIPSTPAALWLRLVEDDRGALVHQTTRIKAQLAPDLELAEVLDCFVYGEGRDLTGYEDGTENPQGEAAVEAAILSGAGPGLDGSSCVAVQRWIHAFSAWDRMSPEQQDHTIGRRRADNEELEEAPPSAHVKRTAQESFSPPAFVLRRSMPWTSGEEAGLLFLAFGASPDPYEALLRRMVGLEDGIVDGLFRFTRPVTGAMLWCPPVGADGRLDLSKLMA